MALAVAHPQSESANESKWADVPTTEASVYMQVPAFPCTRKLILPKNTIDELIFCLLSTVLYC